MTENEPKTAPASGSRRRWLQQPIVQFTAIGAAIFGLYALVPKPASTEATARIEIPAARVQALAAEYERTVQHPPTSEELDALIEAEIAQELLYREGLAAGLDADDSVVRRRVIQKMRFVAEGSAGATADDADLEAWLAAHADQYRIDATYAFEQRYFNPELHDDVAAAIAEAKAALEADPSTQVGDPTLLAGKLDGASAFQIERRFGAKFLAGLDDAKVGTWVGPIVSSYGSHLVLIRSKTPGRIARLEEVREAVTRDFVRARQDEAIEAFLAEARERYDIVVDREAK